MGEQNVKMASEDRQLQVFMQHLLRDVQALQTMLDGEMFETGIIRIGAEQEMCIVDEHFRPAGINQKILEKNGDPHLTLELAKYNLEINLDPLEFTGTCLSDMEQDILTRLTSVRETAESFGATVVLAGILPTFRKFDVELDNMTPVERYRALITAINRMRGGSFELRLRGIDELAFKTDSPLLEAVNTSFQVHMQVDPHDFVPYYNIAQAIAGPVVAVATNSPMLFGKRLWAETRIALFQQSVDTRVSSEHLRERRPRVTFGNSWLEDSILEIYKEDISRFRVLLTTQEKEDALELLRNGEIPKLRSLQIHNSTVYRWNRGCYGVRNGKPHLRIENRVLPAGPTVVDEMSNAAFWLGLMKGCHLEYGDITALMDFDHAKSNFVAASIHGLDTHFRWVNGQRYAATELVREVLLPIARNGLEHMNIENQDIHKYLGVIHDRNMAGMTGSHWVIENYADLRKVGTRDEVLTTLTATMHKNQRENTPVHKWPPVSFSASDNWRPQTLLVEEFMTTDLFTAQKTDILEFVADMMDWRKIRYLPIEDKKGKLIGLISSRIVLREYAKQKDNQKPIQIKDVMIDNPITVSPDSTIIDAMNIMERNKIGCLPVVKNSKLVGIITESDFLGITRRLMDRLVKGH